MSKAKKIKRMQEQQAMQENTTTDFGSSSFGSGDFGSNDFGPGAGMSMPQSQSFVPSNITGNSAPQKQFGSQPSYDYQSPYDSKPAYEEPSRKRKFDRKPVLTPEEAKIAAQEDAKNGAYEDVKKEEILPERKNEFVGVDVTQNMQFAPENEGDSDFNLPADFHQEEEVIEYDKKGRPIKKKKKAQPKKGKKQKGLMDAPKTVQQTIRHSSR